MGIITKEVLAKPNSRYIKLGYNVFTKEGKGHVCKCETLLGKNKIFDFDKYIKVKFEDLPNHSTIPLEIECDNCHKIFITNKDKLMKKKEFKNNGIWYCKKCANSIYLSKEQFTEWSNIILKESNIEDYEFISARKVYCFETNKVYDSTRQCEIEFNFRHGSVYSCCKLLRNNCKHKGYHFIFYDEIENMTESEIAEYYANKLDEHRIHIKCYIDLQNGIIYENRAECMKINNVSLYNKNYDENSYKTERFIPNYLYMKLKNEKIIQLDNVSFYINRRI